MYMTGIEQMLYNAKHNFLFLYWLDSNNVSDKNPSFEVKENIFTLISLKHISYSITETMEISEQFCRNSQEQKTTFIY